MPGRQICILIASSREVAPGDSLVLPHRWRLDDSAGNPLPVGVYRLRGWAYGVGVKAHSDDVQIRISDGS
jgi:hypothetical protein